MGSRPILFLDVDGVLHPFHGHMSASQVTVFHQECMNRLAKIVSDTEAEIVLSTSWRNFGSTRNRLLVNLNQYDLTFSRWIEPDSVHSGMNASASKAEKILSFVQAHHPPSWAVLDDEDLVQLSGLPGDGLMMQLFASRFIQTNPSVGLSDRDVQETINILIND